MATVFKLNRGGFLTRLLCPKVKVSDAVKCSQVLTTKTDPYSTSTNPVHSENDSHPAVKPFSEMPAPKGLPFIGTMLQIPRDTSKLRDFMFDRYEQFSHVGLYRESAGVLDMVVLFDVNNIEKLFRNEGKYPKRFDFELWKHYREKFGQADGVLTR